MRLTTDFVAVKGYPQSSGFISRAGTIPREDAHIVAILREAGAGERCILRASADDVVFIAKTTNPQSVMQLETDSFIGRTECPYNRALTCAGSSDGEGALVASKGSPMGVTTDIGGSTRVPAAKWVCFLYGSLITGM